MSILGIKQIEKQDFCTDWPSYTTKTSDGKIIKSFSLYTTIDGNPYVFGINFDCTDIANVLPAMSFIQDLISFNSQVEDDFISDHKTNSVEEINRAIKIVNKSPLLMNTNERKIVVNHLHENGFFEINGSAKLIAENLNISHHTVYKYLREIRKNNR